ncbi:DUF423 domain-containing protein [Caulobacter segnis]|uniref:DUF423 domain-containing protein n=2 Tax=Caulobacter segnis TaxID=88688 RepID=D5VFW2_CAUST|nr:DUF423 domain-containing protein [Caulobacter segnis]ADG09965.1 protein of unknown function DUF423 [Caulobacter segnis ATCC 21756]AVQ01719.1 DUF423 domain-containing protein [Caulobacter segnis]
MNGWTPRTWTGLAAVSGLLAVAFGAFAAHGVTDPKPVAWLHTGSQYQMAHALAVFAAFGLHRAGARGMGLVAGLFLFGTLIFAGSLYAMALGAPRILGAITPIGGLSFMIGWALLAWRAFTLRDQA